MICYGQPHIGIETGERAGGGGYTAVPVGKRSVSVDGQFQRRAIRPPEQTVEQDASGFARLELELQDRRGSGQVHRQYDVPGNVVRAVQVERNMRLAVRQLGASLDRCNEGFAQYRRCEREAADRKPVEHDAERDVRNLEIVGQRRRRWRRTLSRHVDLGEAERPDVHPPRQQGGRRGVEAKIMRGKIGAVAVANLDPVRPQLKRHGAAQSPDRYGEIRSAYRPLDGSREPILPSSRLQ